MVLPPLPFHQLSNWQIEAPLSYADPPTPHTAEPSKSPLRVAFVTIRDTGVLGGGRLLFDTMNALHMPDMDRGLPWPGLCLTDVTPLRRGL